MLRSAWRGGLPVQFVRYADGTYGVVVDRVPQIVLTDRAAAVRAYERIAGSAPRATRVRWVDDASPRRG